jgi:hypothetical protein
MAGSALYRTLRDVADGHITLWVVIHRYDPHTGQPLEQQIVTGTYPNRHPGLPDAGREWWLGFAAQGWLRLPEAHEAQVWHVTDAGRQWLADHGET